MKQLKVWAFALVAAMITFSASAQISVGDVVKKYEEAGALLNAQKFGEAIPVLEEAIKLGGEAGDEAFEVVKEAQSFLVKAYYQKGALAMKENKLDEALEAFAKTEELADEYGESNIMRQAARVSSMIYMQQGIKLFNDKDYTGALAIFQKGYDRDANNIKLLYFMAKANAELGNLNEANELYSKVIQAGASNSRYAEDAENAKKDQGYYILIAASEAAKAGDMDKLTGYVEMIPDNADAGLLLVQTANNKKMYDTVIKNGPAAYEAQTEADKKSEVAYLLGVAFQNKGNNAKSAEWLRKVTAGGNVSAAKALLTEVTK